MKYISLVGNYFFKNTQCSLCSSRTELKASNVIENLEVGVGHSIGLAVVDAYVRSHHPVVNELMRGRGSLRFIFVLLVTPDVLQADII